MSPLYTLYLTKSVHGYYAQKTIGLKQLENSQPRLSSALYVKLNTRVYNSSKTLFKRKFVITSCFKTTCLLGYFSINFSSGNSTGQKTLSAPKLHSYLH